MPAPRRRRRGPHRKQVYRRKLSKRSDAPPERPDPITLAEQVERENRGRRPVRVRQRAPATREEWASLRVWGIRIAVYCAEHLVREDEWDEAFYDCNYGACPQGHRRMIND